MSGSPLDPLTHMLTSDAIFVGGAALATLSAVMFLRWLGLHWTWTLPAVVLGPQLRPFDQGTAGFVAATSVFANGDGSRHPNDPQHSGDQTRRGRHRRSPLDAGRDAL